MRNKRVTGHAGDTRRIRCHGESGVMADSNSMAADSAQDRATWNRAVVTGASSGIGEGFACELARRGTDLVLVARNQPALAGIGARLQAKYGVTVEILVADLTDATALGLVENRIADTATPIDLLINNAGYGTIGNFADSTLADEENQILLNVMAVTRLTHAALSQMVGRKRGGIINVSSIAGFISTPGDAIYGASKAFVTSFTQAVHEEVRGSGVRVMVVCPGYVRSQFHKRSGSQPGYVPGFAWHSPGRIATSALDALDGHGAMCIPGIGYKALGGVAATLPDIVARRALSWIKKLD